MLSFDSTEQLLTPLVLRSKAQTLIPQMGFVDEAAEFLVRQLRLENLRTLSSGELTPQQCMTLGRYQWVDQCADRFILQYPNALGVELGAGLNTRFQRLCRRLDWPQFRWADIDFEETVAFNQTLLPKIDNYRLVGCDYWQQDWLIRAGWRPGLPLLVILENVSARSSLEQLRSLLQYLRNSTEHSDSPVHVIMDYVAPVLHQVRTWRDLATPCDSFGCASVAQLRAQLALGNAALVDQQDLTRLGSPRYQWAGKMYRALTGQTLWQGVHWNLHGSPEKVYETR